MPGTEVAQVEGAFAGALAVHGRTLFVGEPDNSMRPGTVYAYTREGSAWVESYRFTSDDGVLADGFGSAMAISGDVMAISAPASDNGKGTIYLFDLSGSQAQQIGRIQASDSVEVTGLGNSIAFDGSTLVAGASEMLDGQGVAYVFGRGDAGNWIQETILSVNNAENGDGFGASVAMGQDVIFVGAPMAESRSGSVYFFRRSSDGWGRGRKLTASGLDESSQFGSSIVLADSTVLIGAPGFQRSAGIVVTYKSDERGNWRPSDRLQPFDAASNAQFGSAIAMVGNAIWIGAPRANDFEGAVYAIERDDEGYYQSSNKIFAPDGSGNSGFGQTIVVSEDFAVIGMPNRDGGAGAATVYEQSMGRWSEASFLQGPRDALDSVTGGEVECGEGTAGVFDCQQVDMVSFLSVKDLGADRGITVNDVWGWTDPETGKEWALVGRRDGTSFVDVSNPMNPVFVGDLPLTEGANPSTWRDIKVYRDHAYIVADGAGAHGMQIFDLTRLRDANNFPVTFEADAHYDQIASAHNIVINEETGFAYSVGSSSGGETCGGGLHMIDIRDPKNPAFAGCFSDTSTGRSGTGYSHDAQCIVYQGPDADYAGQEICFGANETALSIADVTDKSNPVSISSAEYPNVGYAHQGWITDDHRYFYLDDELDELQGGTERTRTMIWDITDLDDPQLAKEYFGPTSSSDHNLYIQGNVMYQANYQSGLRVVDISDPVNPVETGYFDTVPYGENIAGFGGAWSNYPFFESGIILVTSGSEGLFVLKRAEVEI